MTKYIAVALVFIMFTFSSSLAMEASDEQFRQEEELLLLGEEFVITATKSKKETRKAPAIVTVITAEEIKNMGARNLTDVLKTVPGFGIQISRGHSRSEIEVRGIGTNNSEKVLVLVDGHKINNPFFGGATTVTTDMPVDNIKRVEVVRGPGSALYGANAFMAVINIITKKAEDVNGTQFTVARGSFDTWRGNILFGNQLNEKLKISGSVDYLETDGAHLAVDRDALSATQPTVSMAPGRTDKWVKRHQLDLSISYAELFFRGNFLDLEQGTIIGARNALSDESKIESTQFWGEFGFDHSFNKDSSLLAKIYYDQFDFDLFWELFPEGYTGAGTIYPDGQLTRVGATNRTVGTNLQWDYKLFDDHQLILGAVFEYIEQFDVRTLANYNTNTNAALGSPPVFQDVSDTNNFNKNTNRKVWAFYAQDDWQINDYTNLVLGVRYDHYSDFGKAVNPRLGLTILPVDNMDIKLLYGRAFRAPNFEELYNQNNKAVAGDSALKAETLDTYEAGVGYRFNKIYRMGINYFYIKIKDTISQIPGSISLKQYANTGETIINGVEYEFKAQYSEDNYGYFNYSFQEAAGTDLANVPKTRGNVGVNFGLTKHLNANTHLFFSGRRPRDKSLAAETRSDLPGYAVVDFTLIAKRFWETMEIKASVYNVFDKDYTDPAVLTTLPNDEPQPGRNYMLVVSYKF